MMSYREKLGRWLRTSLRVGPLIASSIAAVGEPVDAEVIVATFGEKADVGIPQDQVGFMYQIAVSPDGSWWAGHFELDDTLDSFHIRGQGTSFSEPVWIEGQAAPDGISGTLRDVAEDLQVRINDSGQVAGFVRFQELGVNLGQFVYRSSGAGLEVIAATGDPISALPGANYGFDFHSPNISAGGAVSFYADNVTGPSISTSDDALTVFESGNAFGGQRKGVTAYAGAPLSRIDPAQFVVSEADGRYVFAGDTSASTSVDDVIVTGNLGASGDIVMQEGVTPVTTMLGVEVFDVASKVALSGDSWFATGDTIGGTGVVLRDGVVIASEGDVAPNGFEYVGDPVTFATDTNGNVAWVWRTRNPDPERDLLLVYNATQILLSEHDTLLYDLDSDGAPEEIRMDRLFDDFLDLELAGNHVYFLTELDDPVSTQFYGYGFLRVSTVGDQDSDGVVDTTDNCTEIANPDQRDTNGDGFGNICDADLNNDGVINVIDLGMLRAVFFSNDADADLNGDGVVNVVDLGRMRQMFFGPPGPSGLN